MIEKMAPVFLSADWRHLVMLNYPVDRSVLEPLVPVGTELDEFEGTTFVSLVGFLFLDTRVKRIGIPFHRNFEEINLRFYVRSQGTDGWRRGVVFVREVVPRLAIASIARWLYNENYVACPTKSELIEPTESKSGRVEYSWKHRRTWLSIGAEYEGTPRFPAAGSEEEFITEHYWGYTAQKNGDTVEYQVTHPQWKVWSATRNFALGDFAGFYGEDFATALAADPTSAFVADGSHVTVHKGTRLAAIQ